MKGGRVTLTKAQSETDSGRELIALLVELSADGNVSCEELERLRAWLEVDRGAEMEACPFLHEVIEQISSDGEISEDELDQLALAIERVLPKEVRASAALKRKQAREARRVAERETRRKATIAARTERRAVRESERAKAGILYETDFAVRGAFRSSERREACERLIDGDTVTLEREPDNPHDSNAILILAENDCELGYVPRDEAQQMAGLLDAGADAETVVNRLWETPEGKVVPILKVRIRRGDLDPAKGPDGSIRSTKSGGPAVKIQPSAWTDPTRVRNKPGHGCATVLCLVALAALLTGIALALINSLPIRY